MSTVESKIIVSNGTAMAAFVAGGIGAFAMGLVSLLDAAGVLTIPAVYTPAGGVTGRTTVAVLIWISAWALLHMRWRHRDMKTGIAHVATILLTLLGILLAFPGTWALLQ